MKPSQAVQEQVSTPGRDERKHGPSGQHQQFHSHGRKRMKEKNEQSGDEMGGWEGSDPERPAMIR